MGRSIILFGLIFSTCLRLYAQQIKVGVWEFHPIMFQGQHGEMKGLFIDLLEEVAERHQWQIEYRHGTYKQCHEWLIKGEIDLTEAGNSALNQQRFMLSEQGILSTWASIYTGTDAEFTSFFDLEGKRIAVVPQSYFVIGPNKGMNHILSELEIQCEWVNASDYEEVFQMIEQGKADAGLVSRIFGDLNQHRFDVISTPIVFSPFKISFAFSRRSPRAENLKAVVDQHIGELKKDKDSYYYQTLTRYFKPRASVIIPSWVWVVLMVFILGIVQLLLYVFVLRGQVEKRTRGLREALIEIQEREQLLSLIYNNTRDFIGLLEVKGEDSFIVRKLPDWLLRKIREKHPQYSEFQILNMELAKFYNDVLQIDPGETELRYQQVRQVIRTSEPVYFEENISIPVGIKGVAESVMIPICFKGEITHVLYVSRDVTEEREWKEAILQSEERMRLAVKNIPVMLEAFDEHGKLLVWNKKSEEVTGYLAEEMIGNENALQLLYPDAAYRKALLGPWNRTNEDFTDETEITCKDGSKRTISWIHQSARHPIPGWHDWKIGIDVTKRREAEAALIHSEQQLSSMMANLPGMAWRLKLDEDFTMVFVSEGSQQLVGLSPQEFMERQLKPRDFIMEEYQELVRIETYRSVEQMRSGELVIPLRVNGKIKWVLDRFKPVKLANDEIVMDGMLIDISDKLESEQRLQLAIESTGQGMWDWDIETDELIFNDYMAEMLGYRKDEMANNGKFFYDLLHADDREGSVKKLTDHLKGITDYFEQEYRLRMKSGEYKWIMTRGKVVHRDLQGKATRALGVHMNIDARKKAEMALVENERMLSNLMSNLPGMVYKCKKDRRWTMTFVSQGALELTGYTAQALEKHEVAFIDLIVEGDREKIWEEVQIAMDEERAYTLIYRIKIKDGRIRWVWEQGSALEGTDLLEGFITDITDRVEAEEKIVSTVIETEDNERKRIAKELHDGLGQKLTTAALNFNSFKRDVKVSQKGFPKLITGLNSLNSAIKESREIAHNLMPRSIEQFGFVPSVQSMLAEIDSASDIKFDFYDNLNEERFDQKLEVNLYRVIQEAINNILKYSRAKNVTIQLMKYEHDLVLTIEDDGEGFDVGKVLEGHNSFGLKNMRNRVNSLSGYFHIDSFPHRGTIITVELPNKPAAYHEH